MRFRIVVPSFFRVPRPFVPLNMDDKARLEYLEETARRLLKGCQIKAQDGTTLYTPDGKGNYKALWTRDFAYMVENAGDLMPPEHMEACIRYLLKGQRADGAIPDRVRPDGVPVYVAGGENSPLGEPNLDNPPFLVIAADAYLKRVPTERRKTLFKEWIPPLDKGMDYLPLSERGLVYNDPQKPHSPYGFTDTVGKTGELFMESLLYWTACSRLSKWHSEIGNERKMKDYVQRTNLIVANIGQFLRPAHADRRGRHDSGGSYGSRHPRSRDYDQTDSG